MLRPGGDPTVRARVEAALTTGQARWCPLVQLELWNGARGQRERKVLREFVRTLPELPIDDEVWRVACDLARRSRDRGITVPATDIVIAACAVRHRRGSRIGRFGLHVAKPANRRRARGVSPAPLLDIAPRSAEYSRPARRRKHCGRHLFTNRCPDSSCRRSFRSGSDSMLPGRRTDHPATAFPRATAPRRFRPSRSPQM